MKRGFKEIARNEIMFIQVLVAVPVHSNQSMDSIVFPVQDLLKQQHLELLHSFHQSLVVLQVVNQTMHLCEKLKNTSDEDRFLTRHPCSLNTQLSNRISVI